EAALCYYHIDHTMRWLNLDLGLVIEPFQYSGGARFDPHGLNGADNSHYIGSTGRMAFGEGGVDDSEDADVVIHELGHALHDWVTGGSLSQVDGLSEGTGDFAAASYSRSLGQWTPSDPQYQWVFSWDGHNPFWSGRVTNYGAHYPDGLTGSIHTDGQIWSTCLMRIWDQIGREKTDQSCWAGLGMTGSGSSQNDAANAMLQAAIAYGYSQSDISAIVAEFQQTGYTVGAPPEIDVSPLAFTFAVPAGGMDTQQLTIQNLTDPGLGAALEYTISSFEELPFTGGTSVILGRRSAGDRPAAVVSKGAVDLRTGSPPAEDFGGPDAFGYVWFDSDEPGGPVFDWQDVSGVGTSHTLSDDGSVVVNLPFNFPFYGQNESSVRISANGYLTFGPTGGTYTNTGIPDGSSPNELIAGFWDDLNPSLGGTIHSYHDAGTSSFIVQWTGIQHYGGSAPYTFQIVLRASGEILYQYQSMQGDLTSATLGIENAAGDTGLEVVYNAPYVHDGLAVLFRQLAACPWIEANPSSGTVPPQGTQVVDITVDATGLALGEHACTLIVSSNDDDESTIMIPVSLTVGSTSAVETAAAGPRATRLLGNVPNPFNPATTVRYELAHAATVRLSIYDEAGRLVRVLVDGAPVDAGRHAVRWDGRDGTGREVSSGVYFYRLEAGELASTRRGVLLR
ncbi:MAG: FlgD immunoglobulin-like domain containing protein, partial [Candidatus Eiseniibacteriota bacterium]